MALEIDNQFDFFKNVQLDDDGNLLVSIVGFTGGTNYYTTGATLDGTTVVFDRNDQVSAYTVDLSSIAGGGTSGDYLPLSGGTLTGLMSTTFDCSGATVVVDATLDGGSGATLDFEYNVNCGFVGRASEPDKNSPYRIDRLAIGSAYTFSDNLNVLSIASLTQDATVTLPSTPNYSFYVVKDKTGNAGTYPITVSAGDITINGETNYIINLNTKPSITFLWDGEEYITI